MLTSRRVLRLLETEIGVRRSDRGVPRRCCARGSGIGSAQLSRRWQTKVCVGTSGARRRRCLQPASPLHPRRRGPRCSRSAPTIPLHSGISGRRDRPFPGRAGEDAVAQAVPLRSGPPNSRSDPVAPGGGICRPRSAPMNCRGCTRRSTDRQGKPGLCEPLLLEHHSFLNALCGENLAHVTASSAGDIVIGYKYNLLHGAAKVRLIPDRARLRGAPGPQPAWICGQRVYHRGCAEHRPEHPFVQRPVTRTTRRREYPSPTGPRRHRLPPSARDRGIAFAACCAAQAPERLAGAATDPRRSTTRSATAGYAWGLLRGRYGFWRRRGAR